MAFSEIKIPFSSKNEYGRQKRSFSIIRILKMTFALKLHNIKNESKFSQKNDRFQSNSTDQGI